MAQDRLLTAAGLARRYGARRAVADIDITLQSGEVLGLLGANGAGKSTILRMLAGTLAPSAGRVVVAGYDMARAPRQAKRHLGYLPERPPVYPELTVDEYLAFAARLHGVARADRRRAIARAKADTGLNDVGNRLIAHLSKGFAQRVGLAQAVLHRPAVLILDEPTAGLDPHQLLAVRALVRGLAERHAVIISSHILSEIQAVASRVAIVAGGRLTLDDELDAGPDTPRRIEIELAGAPPDQAVAAMLETLDGVTGVERIDASHWRVSSPADRDIRSDIAAMAARHGWRLQALGWHRPTLEERFLAHTEARSTAPAAP